MPPSVEQNCGHAVRSHFESSSYTQGGCSRRLTHLCEHQVLRRTCLWLGRWWARLWGRWWTQGLCRPACPLGIWWCRSQPSSRPGLTCWGPGTTKCCNKHGKKIICSSFAGGCLLQYCKKLFVMASLWVYCQQLLKLYAHSTKLLKLKSDNQFYWKMKQKTWQHDETIPK